MTEQVSWFTHQVPAFRAVSLPRLSVSPDAAFSLCPNGVSLKKALPGFSARDLLLLGIHMWDIAGGCQLPHHLPYNKRGARGLDIGSWSLHLGEISPSFWGDFGGGHYETDHLLPGKAGRTSQKPTALFKQTITPLSATPSRSAHACSRHEWNDSMQQHLNWQLTLAALHLFLSWLLI